METESLNYYKSLVSDDEVIQALLKESKVREGELEKTRIRPNINFLQRTITNLVSTNTRLTRKQSEFKLKEKSKYERYPRKCEQVRRKTHKQLINEFLSKKIDFVKANDERRNSSSKETHVKFTKDVELVGKFNNETKHNSIAESRPRLCDKEVKLNSKIREKKEKDKTKSQKQLINEILSQTKDIVKKSDEKVLKRKSRGSRETECSCSKASLTVDSDSSDDVEIISITPLNCSKPNQSASKQRNQINMIRDILMDQHKIHNRKKKMKVPSDSDSSDDVQIISFTPPDVPRIRYSKKISKKV